MLYRRGAQNLSEVLSNPFEINPYSPQAAGLVAAWNPIASRGMNKLRDMSGRGLDGTLQGTARYSTDQALGSGILLTGITNNAVLLGTDLWTSAELTRGTMSIWYRPSVVDTSERRPWSIEDIAFLQISTSKQFQGKLYDGTSLATITDVTTVPQAGQLYHLALVWDGTNISLFTNGQQVAAGLQSSPAFSAFSRTIYIGAARNHDEVAKGIVGDPRLYGVASPPSVIWQMYAQPWDLYMVRRRFWAGGVTGVNIAAEPAAATGAGVAGSVNLTVVSLPLFDKLLGDVLFHAHAEALHGTEHQAGGPQALKLDDLQAADDTTDLNATTSAHGLLPKGDDSATHFLNGDISWGTLGEYTIGKVATVTGVDMKTAGKTTLYTVPTGKTFFPMFVLVRGLSASLAGGTDYDFGFGASADTWWQEVNMANMTTPTTDFMQIGECGASSWNTCGVAGDEFGIKVITGSTAACTATIDVFGFLA